MRSSSSLSRHQPLRTYKRRYLVCFTFAFNSIANAMIWISFAPIQIPASQYFGVSQNAIDFFSLSFMIAYVPGSLLCAVMFKRYYLRRSFIFSSGLQLVGALLRWMATLHFVTANSYCRSLPFIIAMVGQSLAALAQPFYTN